MAMMPADPHGSRSDDWPGSRRTAWPSVAWAAGLFAGSVVLGLAGGLIWGEFAPRALLQEVSRGTAEVVNVETRAFFGADVWFCAIAVVAGLLTGILGHRFAVSRRDRAARPAAAAALVLGAVAGALVMMWLGEQIGLSAYHHQLTSSPDGTLFSASLGLGAKSALALWPLCTSAVLLVSEWSSGPAAGQAPGSLAGPPPGSFAEQPPG